MESQKFKNPYTHTKEFWYRQFHIELISENHRLAEENFLRYRYWMRRERLWKYLGELCEEKGFRPKEFGNAG